METRANKVHVPVALVTWSSSWLNVIKPALESLYPNIDFTFYLVSSVKDAHDFLAKESGSAGFLVFQLMSIPGLSRPIIQSGKPTVVIAHALYGAGEYLYEYSRARSSGYPVVGYSTTNVASHNALHRVKLLETIARLRESKIAFVVGPDVKLLTDLEFPLSVDQLSMFRSLQSLFGVTPITIDVRDFKARYYDAVSESEASKIAEAWVKAAEAVEDPSREEIAKSAKLYLAIKALARDLNADAVAVDCIVLRYAGYLDAWPCLGSMQFWYDGIVPVCEADPYSAVILLMGKYLLGKPGFINDPGIDEEHSRLICYHCTAPTNPHGSSKPEAPFRIVTAHAGTKHASVHVKLPANEPVTEIGLNPEERELTIHTGTSEEPVYDPTVCATALKIKANAKAIAGKFRWRAGWHRVLFYGDHREEFGELATLLGLKTVIEDEQ